MATSRRKFRFPARLFWEILVSLVKDTGKLRADVTAIQATLEAERRCEAAKEEIFAALLNQGGTND